MSKRIFVASLFQETNAFSPIPTGWESFQAVAYRPMRSVGTDNPPDRLAYQGITEAVRGAGCEAIEGPFYSAVPAAPASPQVWNRLKTAVLEDLKQAGSVDGICLFLHGAQSAEGENDCEGGLLAAIHDPGYGEVPIGVVLDLHANISARLLSLATVVLSCQAYPHTDFHSRGHRLAELILQTLEGRISPVMMADRIPVTAIMPTGKPPGSAVHDMLLDAENYPGVLAASALHGFSAADHEDVGASTILVYDLNQLSHNEARARLDPISAMLTESLKQCAVTMASAFDDHQIKALLTDAHAYDRPLILADSSDNPGGGAPGDSTYLLEHFLTLDMERSVFGVLWDPQATAFCHLAGAGATLRLRIGGKACALSGVPLDVEAEVVSCHSGISQARFGQGAPTLPLGDSAHIRVGNVDIVLASIRGQVFDRSPFEGHNIDLATASIIGLKSSSHFYNQYCDLGRIELITLPGVSSMNPQTFPYRHLARPFWPLDDTPPKPRPLRFDQSPR